MSVYKSYFPLRHPFLCHTGLCVNILTHPEKGQVGRKCNAHDLQRELQTLQKTQEFAESWKVLLRSHTWLLSSENLAEFKEFTEEDRKVEGKLDDDPLSSSKENYIWISKDYSRPLGKVMKTSKSFTKKTLLRSCCRSQMTHQTTVAFCVMQMHLLFSRSWNKDSCGRYLEHGGRC